MASALYQKNDWIASYKIVPKFTDKFIDKFSVLCYIIKKGVTIMPNVASAIRDTVPISSFNRGLAGKSFEDVQRSGAKVVMKNNAAECVLLAPDEYVRMIDELEDARLLAIAMERMAHYDPSKTLSMEEVDARLGFTEEDLTGWEDVEFE